MEDYRTIQGRSAVEIEVKHSRFIASAAFVETEEQALDFLAQIRAANRTANHNVYAYVLREGNRLRYSDDGEPAKTAGLPVLEAIQHAGLVDCIVVVTRYFGGTLLGTGGLVRAYTESASSVLEASRVVTVRSCVDIRVTVEYPLYERAALILQNAGARMQDPEFAQDVTLTATLPEGEEAPLIPAFAELSRGAAVPQISKPYYTPF